MPVQPTIKNRRTSTVAAGESKGAWRSILEQGSHLLQTSAPMSGFDVYVVGFHCAKGEPDFQMEAHHFCRVVNDDVLQCVLFDGNTKDANLIGVEYIISGRLFDTVPEEERGYWHPHNFEVLSGELVAPGLPAAAEKALMKQLMNSYGKTWHTWHTHSTAGHEGMPLPFGDPKLMWSFNRDGEADEAIKQDRNTAMNVDPEKKRAERQSLLELARPQWGVDDMKDDFTGTTPVPGVVDIRAAQG
ncbi:OBAP family protein [Asanoa sp. WMMD1127]|uniref:OBAP family protein n=1 Tax=Asanoa sp. WMMD1127 TaxID=3016107 RepID=UPI002417566E|nr:OBAP family protein [Asanoa sp. WMMD1127]MDG4826242.1 OBAP family protein [Asanoa sp. WMMD1127]